MRDFAVFRVAGRALALLVLVLCSFSFIMAAEVSNDVVPTNFETCMTRLIGEMSDDVAHLWRDLSLDVDETALPRTATLLSINTASWSSDLMISDAHPDTLIDINDTIGGLPAIALGDGGATIVRDYGAMSTAPIAARKVRIQNGSATLATQATFRDPAGYPNTVTIPELENPLPTRAANANAFLRFSRMESTATRSTYFALFSQTPQFIDVVARERGGAQTAQQYGIYLARGMTWLELPLDLDFGTVDIRRSRHFTCPGCDGEILAIAFVGYRSGGGARVEKPVLVLASAAE
jgi:hypothetical protein